MPSNQGDALTVLTRLLAETAKLLGLVLMTGLLGLAGAKYIRKGSPAYALATLIQRPCWARTAGGAMRPLTALCFRSVMTLEIVVPVSICVARRVTVPLSDVSA